MNTKPTNPHPARVLLLALPLLTLTPAASAQCGYDLQQLPNFPTAGGPTASVLVDYNADGRLDIAVACNSAGAVLFYPGNGNATFANGSGFGAGANPYDLCTGDFNHDGRPDFASTGHTGGYCVYLNTNGLPSTTSVHPTPAVNPLGIATADFNSDGHLDLAMTSSGTASVWVMMGLGNGQFGTPEGFATGGIPVGIAAADMNADGRPDLVICNSSTNNLTLLYRTAGQTFAPQAPMTSGVPQPRNIAVGDLDADGRPDIVVGGTGNPNLAVIYRTPEGGFGPAGSRLIGTNGVSVGSIKIADMNADTRPDIIALGANQLTTLLNGGSPHLFTVSVEGLSDGSSRGLSIGDLTGDGLPDVVATQPNFSVYTSLRNLSTSGPLITQLPQRTDTTIGTPATLSVVATATGTAGATLSYRWRRDGVQLPETDSVHSGAYTPNLTILNPTLADHLAVYDVAVSNLCGQVFTRPVGLGVSDPCGSSDFNGDGDFGTDADIEAFFRVLGGGGC